MLWTNGLRGQTGRQTIIYVAHRARPLNNSHFKLNFATFFKITSQSMNVYICLTYFPQNKIKALQEINN